MPSAQVALPIHFFEYTASGRNVHCGHFSGSIFRITISSRFCTATATQIVFDPITTSGTSMILRASANPTFPGGIAFGQRACLLAFLRTEWGDPRKAIVARRPAFAAEETANIAGEVTECDNQTSHAESSIRLFSMWSLRGWDR